MKLQRLVDLFLANAFFSTVKAYCTNLFADGTKAAILAGPRNPLPATCCSGVQTGRLWGSVEKEL